jgi:hypothetical protein
MVLERPWLLRGSIALAPALLAYLALWTSGARLTSVFHPVDIAL